MCFPFPKPFPGPSGISFSPIALFAVSEPGVWYDPSDLTTLFQDAAGTTPVTGLEQPVGLMLDKSRGLTLGSELVTNGTFDTNTTGWSLTGSGATATVSAGVVTITAGSTTTAFQQTLTTVSGVTYSVSITRVGGTSSAANVRPRISNVTLASPAIQANATTTFVFVATGTSTLVGITLAGSAGETAEINTISVRELPGSHASQTTAASRPVLSARYNLFVNTATLATQSVTTVATNYTLRFEGTGSVALSGTASGTYNAGTHTVTCTAGTLTATVTGSVTNADIRPANDGAGLPAYQRVTTSTDYDSTGFPVYLRFDGTDDSLSTASIDFSATDKMTVFAGVRKLSDAGLSAVVELTATSSTNNGAFGLFAPSAAAENYGFRSRGTVSPATIALASTYTSPVTNVLCGFGDIGADVMQLRVNGALIDSATGDQGSGNFSNAALYVGSRGGTERRLNGRLYSLIVRGAASTDAQIASAEAWVNQRTGAY